MCFYHNFCFPEEKPKFRDQLATNCSKSQPRDDVVRRGLHNCLKGKSHLRGFPTHLLLLSTIRKLQSSKKYLEIRLFLHTAQDLPEFL